MEVFFYGLFMDEAILMNYGVNASNARKGYLENYTLKIGDRASLVRCKNERAYGVVMKVNNDEIVKLYAEKSVSDYIPEQVKIVTESNEQLMATCYNLPIQLLSGTNEIYAKALLKLARRLKFPKEYLSKISSYT